MNDLTTLLSGQNAILIGLIVVLLSTFKAVLPEVVRKAKVKRFIPLAPIVLGIIGVCLGVGSADGAMNGWQDKMVLGALAGFTAGQLYKAGKTSIFGWGLSSTTAPETETAPFNPEDYEEGVK